MVQMLGKSGGLNTVSSILEVIANAEKVKDHIGAIRKAEAEFEERTKAQTLDLMEKIRAYKADKAALEASQADVASRKVALDAAEQNHKQRIAELATQKADIEAWEARTSKALSDREMALESAIAKHDNESALRDSELDARERDLVDREAQVKSAMADLVARETALKARDADVTKRETRLREILK